MKQAKVTAMVLTKTQIRAGVWQGVLEIMPPDAEAPEIQILHLEQPLDGLTVTADPQAPGRFNLSIALPVGVISDGVQTFLIRDVAADATLGHFTIVTGEPLEDDIRAEVELLRAELDVLKRAFRRHCLETS